MDHLVLLLLLLPLLSHSAPLTLTLPPTPPTPTPLPYLGVKCVSLEERIQPLISLLLYSVSVTGEVLLADSVSWILNGNRWTPAAGEIHLARTPASEWTEQLMRMKAGGLDAINAYIFWIHHEEKEGQWTFDDRRNVRQFMQTAQAVGLKVLARIGPWDHGECRNGGHPDWLLAKAHDQGFALRTNNTQYMSYVALFYQQLAKQLDGLYWKDGGPIYAIQVDNETPDWRYLLALRDLALAAGMAPAAFTKTAWPAPSSGYPSDYPMLPHIGGYPDKFWDNTHGPGAEYASYLFTTVPSEIPSHYPSLGVEYGGGMASSYNHRVTLKGADMAALNFYQYASGSNLLGYYMYHGGNNPHSLYSDDAPEHTLQESSFMPAGPQNTMPSMTYDFYADLGEFGQPHPHYHAKRRLHIFLRSFGNVAASLVPTLPHVKPANYSDVTTVRWAVRSNGTAGLIFVANYQRLTPMPPKDSVQFALDSSQGQLTLTVPSEPFTLAPGAFFHWPFRFPVAGLVLAYVSAQLLTSIASPTTPSSITVFFLQSGDIAPEIAVQADPGVVLVSHAGNSSTTGGSILVYGFAPAMSAVATFSINGTVTVAFVVLPSSFENQTWHGELLNSPVLALSDMDMVMFNGSNVHLRATSNLRHFLSFFPPLRSLDGQAPVPDGVFSRFGITLPPPHYMPDLNYNVVQAAGPARTVPKASSGNAREPNATEWQAAGIWNISVYGWPTFDDGEVYLNVNYSGDCGRLYYQGKLLTDNWFSGYSVVDGGFQVGLSYIAAENGFPLGTAQTVTFQLHLLPLRKDTLQTIVYLEDDVWPAFDGSGVALLLHSVSLTVLRKIALVAAR